MLKAADFAGLPALGPATDTTRPLEADASSNEAFLALFPAIPVAAASPHETLQETDTAPVLPSSGFAPPPLESRAPLREEVEASLVPSPQVTPSAPANAALLVQSQPSPAISAETTAPAPANDATPVRAPARNAATHALPADFQDMPGAEPQAGSKALPGALTSANGVPAGENGVIEQASRGAIAAAPGALAVHMTQRLTREPSHTLAGQTQHTQHATVADVELAACDFANALRTDPNVTLTAPAAEIAVHDLAGSGPANATPAGSVPTIASGPSPPAALATPSPTPPGTPPNAVAIASPMQLPQVLSESMGPADERREKVVVQLDPPELGRVAFEFKFDAGGLQSVTVMCDTSEAARRLRLLQTELVYVLEQHGLSGDNLSFSQQQPRDQASRELPYRPLFEAGPPVTAPATASRPAAASGLRSLHAAGLDIRI